MRSERTASTTYDETLPQKVETWKHSPAEASESELFGDGKRFEHSQEIHEVGRFKFVKTVNNNLNEDRVEVGVGQKKSQ